MKNKNKFTEPIDIMKPTTDDWYSNYPNNMIKLTYIGRLTDNMFRVAVWGNDDFGVEYDVEQEQEALKMFEKLKNEPVLTKQALYDLKFVNA